MRKTIITLLSLLPAALLCGQTVVEDGFSRLKVHYDLPPLAFVQTELGGHTYAYPSLQGCQLGGHEGAPALPLHIAAITIPFCEGVSVEVENAVYDTLASPTAPRWLPLQPPQSKRKRGAPEVVIDEAVYATDAFVSLPVASVAPMGVARDRRLAQLTFSPVKINPLTGTCIVCRSADLVVSYRLPDSAATLGHYLRYRSSAFQTPTLNALFSPKLSPVKSVRTEAPLRMVVVAADNLRCRMLDRFVEWKRKQGLRVDVVYTVSAGITSAPAMASYLKSLYTRATGAQPAPTYLLIVGDHEQVPAFSSRLTDPDFNDHITDLYFTTWTDGDLLPDCLQGRFSATDTTQLAAIVRKTILYESYTFPDDAYLANAVLVAGVDYAQPGDYAYSYADPTMDYAAKMYVNGNHGFSRVRYYKNDTAFAPAGVLVEGSSQSWSRASNLRSIYNTGIGWINYSAHGDWNQWADPEFTVSQVGNMSNNNKPSFMLGNCCLSNKFDKPVCFGESLLRRSGNAGAAAYIGATNSTYWGQDFYWSVGIRTGIYGRMNTTYVSDKQGMYDGLFHTHSEPFASRAVTAGAMVMKGNMAVQLSSSESIMKSYYWEIYELMGDPSLMPWLGRAETMHFAADTTVRPIRVQAPPYAYVAVVDTATLAVVAAAFTDASGDATLALPDGLDLEATNYSVTAQGYRPYFSKFTATSDEFEVLDPQLECYPNPATDWCTVKRQGLKEVALYDWRGCLVATGEPSAGMCTLRNLSALPHGVYFIRVLTDDGYEAHPLILQ